MTFKYLSTATAFISAIVLILPVHAEQTLSVQPAPAKQGQTVVVLITDSADASTASGAPPVDFNGQTYKTFPISPSAGEATSSKEAESKNAGKKVYRALIGVPALIKQGNYKITSGANSFSLSVTPANFGVQRIRLPKGKDTFDGSPGEKATVDNAKKTLSDAQLWQGKFSYPCKARTSAAFGLRRAVNGKLLEDYFHSGVDFAGTTGTPVVAPQRGKVLIAHSGWKLHGNTVCLDHGQGVVTFYIHLSKILVKEGQMVERGEKIGAVGATGRANGPHLHFSVYVNNEATNPGDWFNKGF